MRVEDGVITGIAAHVPATQSSAVAPDLRAILFGPVLNRLISRLTGSLLQQIAISACDVREG